MKRGLFFLGLGLLAIAFLAGAAEVAVTALGERRALFVPWAEVWLALWPDSLAGVRGQTAPGLRALLEAALQLPGWLLFGAPGFVLMLVFRDPALLQPDREHIESIELYDALAERAHEEGMDGEDEGDDMAPDPMDAVAPPDEYFADEHIEESLLDPTPEPGPEPEPGAEAPPGGKRD